MKYIPMILVILGVVAMILIPKTEETVIEKGALMKERTITKVDVESPTESTQPVKSKLPSLEELEEKYSKMEMNELEAELRRLNANKAERTLVEKANAGTLSTEEEELLLMLIRSKIVVSTKLLEAQLADSEVL